MTAIEITAPGGPEVLRACERPTSVAKPGEVLIRVEAAGVARPDVLQRKGYYAPPPGASDIPGLDVAGVTENGDKVCAILAGGGYAEYVAAPVEQVLPIPIAASRCACPHELVELQGAEEPVCKVY